MAVAPTVGFWIYHRGWLWLCVVGAALNLVMTAIAWDLTEHVDPSAPSTATPRASTRAARVARAGRLAQLVPLLVRLRRHHQLHRALCRRERRHAKEHLPDDARHRDPGHAADVGEAWRSLGLQAGVRALPGPDRDRPGLPGVRRDAELDDASAVIFGLGFGTAYPVYVGYVMQDVGPERRGAAFGAILAAFDTGIGTGSTLMGWLIQEYGFAAAFGTAAALSASGAAVFSRRRPGAPSWGQISIF